MDGYLEGENSVVFEDATFSLTRLKISFVSDLISWAGLIANGEHSFVRILLCILLRARFRGSRRCTVLVFPCIRPVYLGADL